MTSAVQYNLADLLPALGVTANVNATSQSPASAPLRLAGSMTTIQLIPAGQRNVVLASMAGTMHRRGMAPDAIQSALLKVNEQQTEEPLPEYEIGAIVSSISRYSGAGPEYLIQSLNDKGNADRLVGLHGQNIRYSL